MASDMQTDLVRLNAFYPKYLAKIFCNALTTIFRVVSFVCMAVLLPVLSGVLHASEGSQTIMPNTMTIGFLQSAVSGVNLSDAEAAMKVFGQTLGKSYGYDMHVSMHTFKHARDIISGPFAGKIDLFLIDSWSYLEVEQAQWIEPVFVSSEQGEVANRYLLLTHGKGGLDSLTDLRGKSLNLLTASNAMLGIPWLRVLLLEQRLGRPEDFFSQVRYQSDPMPTILQVFFGKKDAALIDAARFQLMTELNPQLNRLKTIETSEPFVNYVLCLKRSGWSPKHIKTDIIEVVNKLHLNPKAQQVFTLFKFERLVPFEYHQLDTVRQLRRRIAAGENHSPAPPDGASNRDKNRNQDQG